RPPCAPAPDRPSASCGRTAARAGGPVAPARWPYCPPCDRVGSATPSRCSRRRCGGKASVTVVTTAPYGSWPTPFTSASVVAGAVRLGELVLDGDDVLWSEGRPAEGGRNQVVRRRPDGTRTDLLAEGWNARTAVHEYGGGGWWARDGVVWFANW